MESKNEIEIPDEVKNKDAYLEYRKLLDTNLTTLPNRLIQTSDVHLSIDPLWNQQTINEKILPLPFNEKQEILKKVKVGRLLQNNLLKKRAQAYGKTITSSDKGALDREQMKMFLDERSSEILEYYGRYLDDGEILKILHLDWGYNISKQTLLNFKEENRDKIATLQERFRKDLDSSKLFHKKYRIEELWYLYKERKINYKSTKSREDVRLMMSLLKQAKEEAEVNQLHITADVNHKIEVTISQHIEREIMANLSIQDIIISRVSHRLGVNPAYIMHRLRESAYARFTGFASPNDSLLEDEIVYPSSMVYDWASIKKKHKEHDNTKQYAEWEDVTDDEKKKTIDVKDELKDRLEKKIQSLSKIKDKFKDS